MKRLAHDVLFRFWPRLWFALKYRVENEYQDYVFCKDEIVPYGDTLKKYMALAPVFKALVKEKTVLEIGCDTGFFPIQAGLLGSRCALGVDRNVRALDKAENVCRALGLKNVVFERACMPDINITDQFDTVFFVSVIHYMFSDKCGNQVLFTTMDSLLDCLSQYVLEHLVIEFPRAVPSTYVSHSR